uniref:Putative group viii salivary lipocalin n=1 Tax=Rhipicephalus pulchellus TaxID=72859 RepID=L7MBX3_RHIPC
MKLFIGSLLFATYFTLPCQGTPGLRNIDNDKLDMAKKLLGGTDPLYLVRAVHPPDILTGKNETVCWTSTRTEVKSQKFIHNITYYNITKPDSAVMNYKLGAWTVLPNMMVSLQTTYRKRKPTIPGDWWLEEAEENCTVLGMHVHYRYGESAICLYWAKRSSSNSTYLPCDNGYKEKCRNSTFKEYNWSNFCDYDNKPKPKTN